MRGKQLVPDGVAVENPAFDVTPHRYISAIVSEREVARSPLAAALKRMARTGLRSRDAAWAASLSRELRKVGAQNLRS
jgi:hypothetical protein